MHVEDIKHALSIQDSATIRSAFFALATEKRVAGLAATNGMALLQAVAAALKDDDSIMPRQACEVLGLARGSTYGVGAATVEANRQLWSEYFAAVHTPRR
jgi:hypothetical protein